MRLILAAAVLSISPFAVLGQTPERPDILFIAVDDMNDWISPLDGNPQTKTPNMERLAARGVTFTNAHAPAVVCNATRTAFLSGLRSSTTGVYFNQNDWETNAVATSVRMLPGYFMDAGYRVMGTGKIFHSGHNDPTSWHGYYPALNYERPDEIRPRGNIPVNNNYFGGTTFDWGPIVAVDSATTDGQIADWMARHLNEPSDAPRFDAIGFRRPHQPWYVPEKYFDMHPLEQIKLPPIVENDLDDVPDAALRGNFVTEGASIQGQTNQQLHEWVLESGQWPNAVQGNLASISFVDAMVGRVLDGLDASGRADNTIIVVFGDHGFHVGEKSAYAKKTLWRESTRVGMFIVAPGVTQPGSRTDAPVNLLDLYPTLTALAGLPTPAHVEGTSLVPLLENPDADWDQPTLTTNGFRNHAITGDRYHYIRWSDGSEELYDFIADPHEFENLASDPQMEPVKLRLAEWLPVNDAPDVPQPEDARRDSLKRLRGLPMLRPTLFAIIAALVTGLVSPLALAHHGTAGRYEAELAEITGTVINLMFINPHALLAVEVEDENGKPVRWMAEFNNPPLMAQEGWHKDILKPGDRVTIIGLPMKNGAPSIRLSRGADGAKVILADTGEVIFTEEPPNR